MIRRLLTTDYDEFCRFRLKSLNSFPIAFSSMPEFFVNAPKEMKMRLLEMSEGPSGSFILGKFLNHSLIGMIGFR